jgi:aminopeptidase N
MRTMQGALDLYFDRHDGEAATIEDWLQVFDRCDRARPDAVQAVVSPGGHPAPEGRTTGMAATYTLTFEQENAANAGTTGEGEW